MGMFLCTLMEFFITIVSLQSIASAILHGARCCWSTWFVVNGHVFTIVVRWLDHKPG
jgi:hypothetical protein